MNNHPQNHQSPDNDSPASDMDNPALDGLIREYARTGSPGDDESLVQTVLKGIDDRVNGPDPDSLPDSNRPEIGRAERDWPWLFSRGFWKLTAALTLVCAIGIGGNAWSISQAQADPTEVMLFTRPRFAPGDDAGLRVLVRDGKKQTPIANAEVNVVLAGNGITQQVATVKTDADGIADITAELDQQLQAGSYTFQVAVAASTGAAAASQEITVARSYRTMLSTDKPLYQPGQTIHMRALSLNVDSMTPAKQRSVQFVVRDGKGNKVFAARPETSDFGIAAADFKLADQVNEGEYQIAVTVGDTTSERQVKVQRYVLPKFRVNLTTDRSYYAPGEEVSVTLNANYTFGKPASGAEVRLEAADMVAGRNVFGTITGTTNAAGLFEGRFKLKNRMAGTQAAGGDAEVFISASVTDRSGETNSKSLSRIVATTPIRIEVFPESGELVPGVENTLFIMTAYPDGTPATTTVTTAAGTEIITGTTGIGKVRLTPGAGELKLSLTARDTNGVTSQAVRTLRVGSVTNDVLLRTDRAIYRQGETAQLTVLSGSPARRAFVDVIRNGRSIMTTAIDLADNQGVYALDLSSDVLGTVQVQAYCIQPGGRIARDTKLIQVQSADQLKVSATLDADSYKPAEQALINFLVQSQDGDPVAAALSLSIVDEAVFALNSSRPGLEEMYFLIQEELLKPRYQFITQPQDSLTQRDNPLLQDVEEAQVVRFSAAEATDGAEPETASGESIRQRQRVVDTSRKESQRSLLRLMNTFPSVVFLFLAGVFLTYTVTRLNYGASPVEPAVAMIFRSEMRLLFWMTGVAGVALPITIFLVDQTRFARNETALCIAVAVVAAVGTVLMAAPAFRIRRLLSREQFGSLFSRVVFVLPALYLSAVAGFLGFLIADRIDSNAFSSSDIGIRTLACLAVLSICAGSLGFLRRTLTENRSWKHNMLSLGIHQSPMLCGCFLIVSLSLLGSNSPTSMMEAVDSPAAGAAWAEEESQTLWFGSQDEQESAMLSENGVGLSAPRVRRFFPETLLWTPQMVTDESGQAQLSVSLADSITTWRLAGSAIARDGRLGSFQQGITVFQDFFIDVQMPVRLTQNDEISIPIGVFNYLNEPQTISLEVTAADWFEFVDNESARSVEAAGNGVQRSSFRIRILKPGRHSVTVRATGTVLSDAVERTVTVIPDGARTEVVTNARLDGDATEIVNIPDHAITGGSDLFVKLYASGFSQVVEGMDSIFQMPHGCFEQTSSTTYPNVLVLNYLRKTEQSNPAIELKALDYIATGYQRLLSYEVDGGGFDWFGRPPANEVLTAYGLHEFTDMAKVYDVDAEMIARTRRWLLGRRESNGTWSGGDLHQAHFHDDSSSDRTLRQTAYIVWALAASGDLSGLNKSIRFLEQNADTRDPYVLAIVANAFIACGREQASQDAVARLSDMAQQDDVSAFWASEGDGLTYSFGASLTVETTALVVQAMISTGTHGQLTTRALDWLTSQRDARGTWHSTQATVQAMRALLMAESGGRVTQDTTIDIMANGRSAKSLTITEDTGDVFHLVSLTESVQSGANTVSLSVSNESRLSYQLVTVYYTPRSAEPVRDNPVLEIDTSYGQRELTVDDLLTVEVTLRYHRPGEAPMTLVDLGIPPGFEVEMESFRNLVNTGVITRFEPKGQQISLYFDQIPGDGESTRFEYRLRAKYPVTVKTPASVAYQYYEPEVRDETQPELLTVR